MRVTLKHGEGSTLRGKISTNNWRIAGRRVGPSRHGCGRSHVACDPGVSHRTQDRPGGHWRLGWVRVLRSLFLELLLLCLCFLGLCHRAVSTVAASWGSRRFTAMRHRRVAESSREQSTSPFPGRPRRGRERGLLGTATPQRCLGDASTLLCLSRRVRLGKMGPGFRENGDMGVFSVCLCVWVTQEVSALAEGCGQWVPRPKPSSASALVSLSQLGHVESGGRGFISGCSVDLRAQRVELCTPKRFTEIQSPSTCECDLLYR